MHIAKVLYINGQTTQQVVSVAQQLGQQLNLQVELLVHWGELQLIVIDENTQSKCYPVISANPTAVHMGRVQAIMILLEDFKTGNITLENLDKKVTTISNLPPAPTWMFTWASALGAVALAIIFGLNDWSSACFIFFSAALGALVRRYLATISTNVFIQPFSAAFIAGLIGALAVHSQRSVAPHLEALCPCMILVPGPHLLNSALDFMRGRMHLGLARLSYALLIVVAISVGLLAGLSLLNVNLPIVSQAALKVPFWKDVLAAGVAVAAYNVFFSTPLKVLAWPIVIGMCAHWLRWIAMSVFGLTLMQGTFLACLLAGCVLTWAAHREQVPFAAFGFSAVVSMIPGVFLFRMASGLMRLANGQETTLPLISGTISDAITATVIILVMSLGLLVPKLIMDNVYLKHKQ
ncbi:threonine/serine ThrE exporter family protein [Legionella oakridgensis]|uniref:threonine/serine ThrE exporter family protein n=1 Tax=Legionella oakridgensis TaxID=29423 RepID=UPI001EE6726B|nr:threonine/serine exporter family protein [Legionella oakridgensis]